MVRKQHRRIKAPCCGKQSRHEFPRGMLVQQYDCECGKRYELRFRPNGRGGTGRMVSKKVVK